MLIVHAVIALFLAVCVWYALSRGLSQMIFAAETRKQGIGESSAWSAIEAISTLAVFFLAVGVWIGLTYLFEWLSH